MSSRDCSIIPQACIEIWLAGPEGDYKDDYRATIIADESGRYRFESHRPPSYSGRPPHIHIRVTADGFKALIPQDYPKGDSSRVEFDIVLIAE